MDKKIVLVIGEVFIDAHLDIILEQGPVVRLGGVFHPARAFSAMGVEYALAYFAPTYLEEDINNFACLLKAKLSYRLGILDRAPNIMLVNESREAGEQGYYNILKDQAVYNLSGDIRSVVERIKPTDVLILPGRYDTSDIINKLSGYELKIHIDCHYDSDTLMDNITLPVETLILSTSSELFKKKCEGTLAGIVSAFKKNKIENFLVKENRGGSYCYSVDNNSLVEAPAHYVPTMHSVGVGDVFNAVFISYYNEGNIERAIRLASMCAAKYAETLDYEKFKQKVSEQLINVEEIIKIEGIRIPWEDRKNKQIYIAAPDFPDVDTTLLNRLVKCLEYHNFRGRLPVRENGLADNSLSAGDEEALFRKDVALMNECDLLIAVLLYNDPGTLVELGMFKQMGKPTIIFDPYKLCSNMFVRHTPKYLCETMEDVVSATFCCLRRA